MLIQRKTRTPIYNRKVLNQFDDPVYESKAIKGHNVIRLEDVYYDEHAYRTYLTRFFY